MKQVFLILFTVLIHLMLSSCEKSDLPEDTPNCIKRMIRQIEKESVQNPPARVMEWKFEDETYYYITSGCCDQFNYLYDRKCNVVCAPDGGFAGIGDGNCPEFSDDWEETLLWEDPRNWPEDR